MHRRHHIFVRDVSLLDACHRPTHLVPPLSLRQVILLKMNSPSTFEIFTHPELVICCTHQFSTSMCLALSPSPFRKTSLCRVGVRPRSDLGLQPQVRQQRLHSDPSAVPVTEPWCSDSAELKARVPPNISVSCGSLRALPKVPNLTFYHLRISAKTFLSSTSVPTNVKVLPCATTLTVV